MLSKRLDSWLAFANPAEPPERLEDKPALELPFEAACHKDTSLCAASPSTPALASGVSEFSDSLTPPR